MDDLHVESYDEKEIAAKKRSVSKRIAAAGGVVVLTLGVFGLVLLQGSADSEYAEEQTPQVEERRELPPMPGGSGSWFVSILEEA